MSDKKIIIYTPQEIEAMRDVCRRASELLDYITPFVKAGVSTLSLDELMLEYTEKVLEAKSACLNYCPPGMTPYPRATCISVNNVICHGIPSEKKILKNGDIVNIDVTIVKDGFYGDTSRMFIVGKPTIAGKRLVEATWGCMWAGIEAVKPGNCFNDIGIACQKFCAPLGLSIVHEYGGHGIGRVFHGEPHVSHVPLSPAWSLPLSQWSMPANATSWTSTTAGRWSPRTVRSRPSGSCRSSSPKRATTCSPSRRARGKRPNGSKAGKSPLSKLLCNRL